MNTPDSQVQVRDAEPADLQMIVSFNAAMAAETEDLQLDEATVRRGVQAVFDDESKGRFYIATIDGQVAGQLLVTFEWSDWRDGMFLWIQSVYVAPPYRRRGVFKALYAEVIAQARQPGVCGVRLYVSDENPDAQKTYQQLGMEAPGYVVMETPDTLRG